MNFRTDLADERREVFRKINKLSQEIPGIESEEKEISDTIKVHKVKVTNNEGEQALQKPIGTYVTIDVKKMKNIPEEEKEKIAFTISGELQEMIKNLVSKKDEILIVGLGNLYSTPDSLGPKVIQNVDVTRHIFKYLPQYVSEDDREVAAISPGVLGTTGIETQEILKGISSSVQLSDTGIVPGAGVGNKRRELSQATLGVPVIAIGIPTVVDVATITNDCLELFIEKLQDEAKSNDYLNQLKQEDNYQEIKDALVPKDFNLIVTPKEIDELILNMTEIVACGINKSL